MVTLISLSRHIFSCQHCYLFYLTLAVFWYKTCQSVYLSQNKPARNFPTDQFCLNLLSSEIFFNKCCNIVNFPIQINFVICWHLTSRRLWILYYLQNASVSNLQRLQLFVNHHYAYVCSCKPHRLAGEGLTGFRAWLRIWGQFQIQDHVDGVARWQWLNQVEGQLDYGPGYEIGVGWKIGVTWSRKRGFKMVATELGYLLTKLSFWLSLWCDITIFWHGGKEL